MNLERGRQVGPAQAGGWAGSYSQGIFVASVQLCPILSTDEQVSKQQSQVEEIVRMEFVFWSLYILTYWSLCKERLV